MVQRYGIFKPKTLLMSDTKNSQYIIGDLVVFSNSIGDITAVDIESG